MDNSMIDLRDIPGAEVDITFHPHRTNTREAFNRVRELFGPPQYDFIDKVCWAEWEKDKAIITVFFDKKELWEELKAKYPPKEKDEKDN